MESRFEKPPRDLGHLKVALTRPERRATPRVTLLLRTAKLKIDGQEAICIIKDVSEVGISVRLFQPIPAHRKIELEVGSGEIFAIQMVWCSDDQAGFCFADTIELQRLLDEQHGAFPKRQVRIAIDQTGYLHAHDAAFPITFRNISQQGASIVCDEWLAIDELVRIETPVLSPIYAKVRWRRRPNYGLVFEQPFGFDCLARFCASGQLQTELQHSMIDKPACLPQS